MTKIVDVAKAAGVSVATVSRALNGKTYVSDDLRARILRAVDELHYVPNPTARNLRRNESRVILILAPNITNPYYTHIIAGISDAAHERGYGAFLCNTADERDRVEQQLARLRDHQADGAIMLAMDVGSEWLRPYAEQYPLVLSSEFDPDIPVTHVSIDNYGAARDVMTYLLGLGHRRIGFIGSTNHYHSTVMRTKGYCDALRDAHIEVEEDFILGVSRDYTFKSGFGGAQGLLKRENRPTALFCISDMLALGAIAGARELGLRVPQDVTVIGFDDVEHTTMFHPYVTTVVQPCFDIGHTAMELLYRLMHGAETPLQTVLPHRLLKRESSAPPSQA